MTHVSSPNPEDLDWHCYRHPAREAGVKCRRCERPICPDCMITAPVGFQCRECVKAAPAVRSLRTLQREPHLVVALIVVNVVTFVLTTGEVVPDTDLALFGPIVADGEWWRIVTSGFLHFGLLHLAFNMVLLWWLGQSLEAALGRVRFGLLYAAALLSGSLGVLLLDPNALTGGASGAVFGLMGATVLFMRRRGVDPMQSGLVGLIGLNLLITFVQPGISVGGHVGGLVGGAVAGAILVADDRPGPRVVGTVTVAALVVALAGASLWLAANPV